MKLATQAIFLYIFALSITLFWGTGVVNPTSGDILLDNGTIITSNVSGTDLGLQTLFTSPSSMLTSYWWDFLLLFITGLGFVGLAAGIFRVTTTDAVTFLPLTLGYLSLIAWPIGKIFMFLKAELGAFICGSTTTNCFLSIFIVSMIVGGLAFNWVTACFKFLRTGFTE